MSEIVMAESWLITILSMISYIDEKYYLKCLDHLSLYPKKKESSYKIFSYENERTLNYIEKWLKWIILGIVIKWVILIIYASDWF